MRVYLLFASLLFCSISFAQNIISGTISDANGQPIIGANVTVSGEKAGAVTDIDGKFSLNSPKKFPFTLDITSIGYTAKKVNVTTADQKIAVTLKDEQTLLNEIVVSASRTPERVLESPVTIERMGIADIKKTASATFYDGLENLKEVQFNTSSLTFKTINTRGFSAVGNTRFLQLVDGMDNSSPLLNFSLGNLLGVSEIDVQSVELLPGASSALYGASAFNGILFMNSKSPFTSQGITAYAKFGQTSQNAGGNNDYIDYGFRLAKAFSPKFAAKANFSYLRGSEWHATNYDDKTVQGRDRSHYGYEGINVYGDEVSIVLPAPLPSQKVSRTGYNEVDLTQNKAGNTKIDYSLHYRPLGNENLEIILQSKFAYGNSVYQGAGRYNLNNFFIQQHKLEVKGKNFFVRGYTTTEDGGNSYEMLFTGINLNRQWKSDTNWFTDYASAYTRASIGGLTDIKALDAVARNFADYNISPAGLSLVPNIDPKNPGAPRGTRLLPGTPEFIAAFNKVINDPASTGSKLVDNSTINHADGNYNFKDIIKFAEIQVGGSYRQYKLNSQGRIYTDGESPIFYAEYGAYTQLTKKMLDDRLKFTGSIRYDKSQNFDGNFSPRISFVYSAGAEKRHNFRASFQTGFRNPSTQEQYIGFNIGTGILLGSAPDNLARFTETLPISAAGQLLNKGVANQVIDGTIAYTNSYTANSVAEFSKNGDVTKLEKTILGTVKPEEVKAFEIGYRSLIKGTSIDINGYYNIYNNFIANIDVVSVLYGKAQNAPSLTAGPDDEGLKSVAALTSGDIRGFRLFTNSEAVIKSFGFGAGVSRKIYQDFELGANYNYAEFSFDQSKNPDFEAGFNTPKHKVKVSFGNEKLFKNFGFNISGRWSSSYLWQSSFADGIIPSVTVVDAQVNYEFPKLKSTLKIGASNIGNNEYFQVIGPGRIGQQYFASWTINP